MAIRRIYIEKKNDIQAKTLKSDLKHVLGLKVEISRYLRYDIDGMTDEDMQKTIGVVFSEPPIDNVLYELPQSDGAVFAVEYLPGQYDQRADSACQCVQLVTGKARPVIRCATVYVVNGADSEGLSRIKNYLINPVEARIASLELPKTLEMAVEPPKDVAILNGFNTLADEDIAKFHAEHSLAMTVNDLKFVRDYFKSENRQPTITEIRVIDTYWSDHCRHTTFSTELTSVEINSDNPHIAAALQEYDELFAEFNGKRKDKYKCLMDIATIAVKKLKKLGLLNDLDESEEINACSIKVRMRVDGKDEDYLVMFKNETHNHPTEIEPFGGAATCLGGAIRDPLSGRTYVYQAMRVTGAADPRKSFKDTLKGKLPQRVITNTAAAGFASYGNQIGLATGTVSEMYHENYVAKRLETGFVVGANRAENVRREVPQAGDVVILLGGETGRDGCGGATGSSKAHTLESLEVCGAEVQKGNPLTERKLQRLFRNGEITKLIKRCNDFGAGGVSVAIGELADGIDIDLSVVPKKYEGLDGTELAISESQERMAVVIAQEDEPVFVALAATENLGAVRVATVTDTGRMRMTLGGRMIVDISRDFLNTNGVRVKTAAVVEENVSAYMNKTYGKTAEFVKSGDIAAAITENLSNLNVCSQQGLSERFDSTIGAGSVFMPFGGKYQLTPSVVMAAKIPTENYQSKLCSVAAFACSPQLMSDSPFIGSMHSIVTSVSKLVAAGCDYKQVRLTLQEFFKRLNLDKKRFGQPVSALLGALHTEMGLGLGAIGGKDSMSGTFENIDVPPTLISFALAIEDGDKLITNVLGKTGQQLYAVPLRRDRFGAVDFTYAKQLYERLHMLIADGKITYADVVGEGGAVTTAVKSALGNGVGIKFASCSEEMFLPRFGDFVVALDDEKLLGDFDRTHLGTTVKEAIYAFEGSVLSFEDARTAFTSPLASVFKFTAEGAGEVKNVSYTGGIRIARKTAIAKPRVFIPVFPGTNCEYDTAAKFRNAGAEVEVYVVRNRTASEIETAAKHIEKAVNSSNIIAFPGGFSGGDEPDGSGKFIVAMFKNPRVADSVNKLLTVRDGLVVGICNGFQAIIKLGLIENGIVSELSEDSCTLTYNNISRHVSTVVTTRIAGNLSPWLAGVSVGEIYKVAVSHGEGKLVGSDAKIAELIKNGQVATQYADLDGNAVADYPFNPNGSLMAIEGLCSKDGRVLAKMGHSERIGENVMKNIDGNFDMKIFESGVNYFK